MYLDHAATTPVLPEVVSAVSEAMGAVGGINGNPSSVHAAGRSARQQVEQARESIAADLRAHPSELVFTSGGTESDNLAVGGLYRAAGPGRRAVLLSAAEHHAVLETAEQLPDAELRWLPLDGAARVSVEGFRQTLAESGPAALAAVMWANNETGAVTDLPAVADAAAFAGVPLHCDAVQAIGSVPIAMEALPGVTTLALTGHKIGGPPGVGALVVRRDAALAPLLHGGGHERGLRSGTLNVPGIVGLAVAVNAAVSARTERNQRLATLSGELLRGVLERVPGAVPTVAPGGERLPGTVHLTFPGCEAETLLMLLDAAGVQCSAGSACTAGVTRASHVLVAAGMDTERAASGLRFSLGHTSSADDVAALLAAIGPAVERARVALSRRRSRGAAPALVPEPAR